MAAIGGFPGQDHTHELNVYLGNDHRPAPDPDTPGAVDTTGWDLDHLAATITAVGFDARQGNNRPLTTDEADDLTGPPVGLPDNGETDYWTSDPEVQAAVETLAPIVDEAVFQRDLAAAFTALHAGREPTPAQRDAYDAYVAGFGHDTEPSL